MSHAHLVRSLSRLAVVTVGIAVCACGGGNGSVITGGSPVVTQPTPQPPVVVSQMSGASLPAQYVGGVAFSTTRSGTLDVTVDWTYAANDVDVALASGSCSLEQLQADQCRLLAFAVSSTAKPERLQLAAAAAGSYTLLVENNGPDNESVSYQVVLTPSAVAAATQAPAGKLRWKRPPRGMVELR